MGYYNTANGSYVLVSNTTGGSNTANGSFALHQNTTGNNNTAFGYKADVTSGNLTNATAIGANAEVTASNTIQLGNNAVTTVYAGVGNTTTLVTGNLQVTGGTISTATNTALNIEVNNKQAGKIDHVKANTFYGYQSGNTTTSYYNTANGFEALYINSTGGDNTANGFRALYNNTIGGNNTAIGSEALYGNIIGENNTALGSDANVSAGNLDNATAIGSGAIVNASNKVVIGNSAVTVIGGYANWSKLSDARFKKNIQKDVHGLDFIMQLKPVTYNLDIQKLNSFLGVNDDNKNTKQTQAIAAKETIRYNGFLAQEVEQAAAAVQYNFSGVVKPANAKDHYSMSYSDFVVPLVKGMQEQEQKIEAQEKTNEQLKNQVEAQQKINQQLQQQIDELKKLIVGNNSPTKDVVNKQVGTANTEDITLYPNPTTGICTVTASNINNGVIEIYDMAGNSLQKTVFDNAKSGYQLNVSGYAKGVYLLNIIAHDKKYTKRLVIQ